MRDVIFIGGGPAGSTGSCLLKKYKPDMDVLVLEREKFPREHVGESQLPPISAILDEMGCWDKVEAADFPIKIGATYRWGNTTDLNSCSIGIELDNNGSEPFSEAQINSLIAVLDKLQKAHGVPTPNFIGHADIAPGRKVDPSRYFPWEKLAKAGYGIWYDTTSAKPPADLNLVQGLRIIGYNTANERNAIQSYRIHFTPNDTTRQLHEGDRKIIWDLMKKS
jgi:N-acetyl-anhydromuramyl-L-alanine amidase AmpD